MINNPDNSIEQYYCSVDKNIISDLSKKNNLKNLIYLSTISDIYLFNKKNKKWNLKSKHTLLKECDKVKKKELKKSSIMLSNLAKLDNVRNIKNTNNIKNIYDTLNNKIINIDNIIDYIVNIDSTESNDEIINLENYIECYSNC